MARRQETFGERTPSGPSHLRAVPPEVAQIGEGVAVPGGADVVEPTPFSAPRRPHAAHRRGRVRHHGPAHHRHGEAIHRRARHESQTQTLVYVERMPVWKSTCLAVASLVFVLGIAFAVMAGVGQILHVVSPSRRFDIFYALHKEYVVVSLIAACLLWMLPPHPWAKRLVKATSPDAPTQPPEAAGVEQPMAPVTALSSYDGREPLHRPLESQGVAG